MFHLPGWTTMPFFPYLRINHHARTTVRAYNGIFYFQGGAQPCAWKTICANLTE
jgi:hypothetical protein